MSGEKSEAEKKNDAVEKRAKPPEPEPMVPPVTPAMVAQKVRAGSRFWAWVPVPICVPYDDVKAMNQIGRVRLEEMLDKLVAAQINSPRKQKGKDAWMLKVEYPVNPGDIVGDTCKRIVGQIRAALSGQV